jgi:RNA polymerase sigma factor (sigma-70 family)
MPARHLLSHVRRLAPFRGTETDAVLLNRFASSADGDAFAALVRRHWPMVWCVCRRVLHDAHEAEDASQATFLVLARKAAALRRPDRLAAWLHGTAHHLALNCRTADVRRKRRDAGWFRSAPTAPPRDPLEELTAREFLACVDEEVRRLPEVYRLPVILCCLEGYSQEEAARRLGWTPGSVKGRLERGRTRLHAQLAGRGLGLSAALAAVEVARGRSLAGMSERLTEAVARPALAFATGEATVGTMVPVRAVRLAEEGLRSIRAARLLLVSAVLLATGMVLAGAGLLAYRGTVANPDPVAQPPEPPARRQESPGKSDARKDRYGDPLPLGAVARLGTVRWRNIGLSCLLAFSPDDRVMASRCWDSVILWDTATGRQLHRLPTSGRVDGRAFTPDGKILLLPDGSGNIVFWNVATGKRVRTLALPGGGADDGYGYRLSISPDGNRLAVRDGTGTPLLLDTVSGRVVHALGGPAGFCEPAFAPDGKTVVLQALNGQLELWDVATGKRVRALEGPRNAVAYGVAFAPDGKTLAWAGEDQVALADVSTGKEILHFDAPGRSAWSVRFMPDGKALVTGGFDGTVRIWDLTTRKVRSTLHGGSMGATGIALSHDGKRVAEGFQGRSTIRLWDVASGKPLFTDYEGHADPVYHLAFAPDGRTLVTGDLEGQVRWWDAATWKPVRTWDAVSFGAALAAAGKRLATLDRRTFHVRDAGTGVEFCAMSYPELQWPWAATFAREDKDLVFLVLEHTPRAEDVPDAHLDVWDTANGKRLQRVHLQAFDLLSLDVFPGWRSLAVTPDGRTALVGDGPGTIRVCDLEQGQQVLTLAGHRRYADALAVSADGKVLVSGSLDRTVRLWDLMSAQEIATLRGHRRAVAAVALSADGRLVASADGLPVRNDRGIPSHGYDDETAPHQVQVWDAATGAELACFEGHATDVASLLFAPDGRRLVTGLRDGSVLVWDLTALPCLPALDLPPGGIDAVWQDLASPDAGRANRAAWTLAVRPDLAVPFLKDHVPPATELPARQVRRWIADLDSDTFEVRTAAARELERHGEPVVPALREALAGSPSAELRKRAEELLAGLRPVRSPERLQRLRALQVLERIGTPAAWEVLERLARGQRESRLTSEAEASLERLARRPPAVP